MCAVPPKTKDYDEDRSLRNGLSQPESRYLHLLTIKC